MKYYLLLNGEIKGPFQIMTVREMLSAGAIQESTLMAQEGSEGWQPAATVMAQAEVSDQSRISGPSSSARSLMASRKWELSRYMKVGAVFAVILVIWGYYDGAKARKSNSVNTHREHNTAQESRPGTQGVRVPSNGEVLTAVKIEDISDYSKSDYKIFDKFEDLLTGLTNENYLGRMRYKDLPVTWWAGTAEFNLQKWMVTTNNNPIWIDVYERRSDRGRVIINVYDENLEPSDFYGILKKR
jgi:hypothetical protein